MTGIADHIADLAAAFPQRTITRETLSIYARELGDLDPVALGDAVRRLIRTSEFFPTIHAIRDAVAEDQLGLPGEAEALRQVNARAAFREPTGPAPTVHPLVREAVNLLGGWHAIRATDEPGVMRGQLLRLYRELRHARVAEHVVSSDALVGAPNVRELGPG